MTIVETSRLLLDRLTGADGEALLSYRSDPEVARYQSWENVTRAEIDELIESQAGLAPGTPGTWFQVAVRDKATGRVIGDCGLYVEQDDPRLGEIGFTFSRDSQGQGFASEATHALLGIAFERLSLHRVKAIVDCRNQPAVRLLERLGFRREGHFLQHTWFKGSWCDEYLYALLRSEWQSTPPPV